MIEKFTQSRSRIHISLDIWSTSAGNRSYLGVVEHWVDANFEICTTLIAQVPSIDDCHTGANIVNRVIEVAEMYKIGHKIGYCMADSASNNGTAMI